MRWQWAPRGAPPDKPPGSPRALASLQPQPPVSASPRRSGPSRTPSPSKASRTSSPSKASPPKASPRRGGGKPASVRPRGPKLMLASLEPLAQFQKQMEMSKRMELLRVHDMTKYLPKPGLQRSGVAASIGTTSRLPSARPMTADAAARAADDTSQYWRVKVKPADPVFPNFWSVGCPRL